MPQKPPEHVAIKPTQDETENINRTTDSTKVIHLTASRYAIQNTHNTYREKKEGC